MNAVSVNYFFWFSVKCSSKCVSRTLGLSVTHVSNWCCFKVISHPMSHDQFLRTSTKILKFFISIQEYGCNILVEKIGVTELNCLENAF
jgi:hypothetical protein